MAEIASEIYPINIEDELKQSYLDYAMSVIVGRALPDARDGLKPVHRRVLYAMHELNNDWNKPHKKSARVVGDVIGKYHPHGDTAVYDTIVRMAQPFSLRYLLVDGQGNFGSVDGDPPAAMRYTEIRMSKFAHTLLADIDKETVDFAPNYDGTEHIPIVLPTRAPNLLVNGSSGIAVGMATNIPPHNLNEVVNACLLLIEKPTASVEEIMKHLPGPDFPTAGIISGRAGIVQAYKTGRGRIFVRARTEVENQEKGDKQSIIINELPYQVNKARLIEKIAELVKDKKIEGITALRDESDKDGMRVVIELRRGEVAEVVLNNLYAHTQLQTVFGINMVALVEGRPQTLPVKDLLEIFLRHRREVVTRRTIFELRKARERTHILEGLAVALANIDPIIALIKASATPADAKAELISRRWQSDIVIKMLEKCDASITRPDDLSPEFGMKGHEYLLSPTQAQAILDLRLHRLTGLEKEKIYEEYHELIEQIKGYLAILASAQRLMEVIRQDLEDLKKEFGDKRRTEISSNHTDLSTEDLITDETVVVTLSQAGYVKYQPVSMYQAQRRGGKGKLAAAVKDEDVVTQLMIANTHDTILCFSSIGKVYWLKVYQLPQASRISRGRPIINMLPLSENEKITTMLPLREYSENCYAIMATAQGTIKKTALTAYSRPRASGIIALELDEGDELVNVAITNGENDVMLFSDAGKVIRFNESNVREMGRTARGVRGIRLSDNQKVISMVIPKESGQILTATQNGYGKRTPIDQYPAHGRGGQGVISIQVSERNGLVVGATQVFDGDEMFLISDKGTMVRTRVDEISVVGRNTQGVRLISLSEDESLVSIQRVEELENIESLPASSKPIETEMFDEDANDFPEEDEPNDDPTDEESDDENV